MCATFGIWSERDELARLGAALAHRGPDDEGRFDQGLLHLGHKRLAIVDLGAGGRQPMVCDDGSLALSFNGEIYNHRELRHRLAARGHRFSTRTDSEVVLAAFREWGDDAVHELVGIFALALWKANERELLLIRDPTGVKPLFYVELEDRSFAFASELKALLTLSGVRRELHAASLWQYLDFGYCWTDDRTVVAQVRKVLPGHALRVRDGRVLSTAAWYRPSAPGFALESQEQLDRRADELLEVLVEVVEQQLDADVPVGLLLSGGIDSSILAAICASVLKADIPTFTVGFDGASQEDLRGARLVADKLGCAHHELMLDGSAIVRELRENAAFFDDLFWDPGLITSLALFRWCRSLGIVVALVGEGADELFAGYSSFSSLGDAQNGGASSPLLGFYRFFRHYTGQPAGRSLEAALAAIREIYGRNRGNWYDTIRDFELHYQLPNNLNAKVDRSSMASAVEARVPYQDPRVTALGLAMPCGPRTGGKLLLKHMAKRHELLPEAVIARTKLGLMMPRAWIVTDGETRAFAERSLLDEGIWARRLGIEKQLAETLGRAPSGPPRDTDLNLAWRLMILEHWSRNLGLADAPMV